MSEFDHKILSLYIVFGFFIMMGYALMTIKYTTKGSSEIWSNRGKNMILKRPVIKYIYILMIFLSFIAGSYLIYYLTTTSKTDTDEILIYVGSVVFLVCSTVWAFWPFEYSKIILGAVAIGSILILSGICVNTTDSKDSKKVVALTASSVILIQTVLFDFLIWNGLLKF